MNLGPFRSSAKLSSPEELDDLDRATWELQRSLHEARRALATFRRLMVVFLFILAVQAISNIGLSALNDRKPVPAEKPP